jgi:uncharacterized protein YyaL (SSP411 family)
LQHAHNPVDWHPWGDVAFEKAKKENKLIIVSIGYSACHWCHVMEHESFEDTQVAKLMNEHFVSIKVDREERPDIDQLYMDAVHLMSGRGGWPLNCFALPDGRPVYGGTYFPKEQWMEVLASLDKIYKEEPAKVIDFAKELERGIVKVSTLPDFTPAERTIDLKFIDGLVADMQQGFDKVWGGHGGAPKFPMPNNYEFLLHYSYILKNLKREDESKAISDFVFLTLDKMAMGGIYDILEGGFARYSTDAFWKAPHFEKMLYDNGQLMSLYSNACKYSHKKLYKEVVYGIYSFIANCLMSPEGGFYCALDADSEGKEGEYYVWKKEELQSQIGADFPLFAEYFSIHDNDIWEDGKFILFRKYADDLFCNKNKISVEELESKKQKWIEELTHYRKKRIAPGLDDKILGSWNGLMLKGLIDAYEAFGDKSFLDTALKNANFICEKLLSKDGSLWRNYKNGKATIQAFLEDYAFVADAFFHLYQCTFDEKWLNISEQLVEYTLTHFYDKQKNIFYFTANYHNSLITRKAETSDNVIPASNSAMANLLFKLGHCVGKDNYIKTATGMLSAIKENMEKYPYGYTNWAILALYNSCPFYEVAIAGKGISGFRDSIQRNYLPNKIVLGTEGQSKLELLEGKFAGDEILIYVCENKTCFAPVHRTEEAIVLIEKVK